MTGIGFSITSNEEFYLIGKNLQRGCKTERKHGFTQSKWFMYIAVFSKHFSQFFDKWTEMGYAHYEIASDI